MINLSGRVPDQLADSGAVRQDLRSKINRATTSNVQAINELHCARSVPAPGGQRPWMLTAVSAACAMSVSSTLPPVRLNNQAYQNVVNTVAAISGSPRSNCGMKTSGKCQPVIRSPRRAADANGDHLDCRRGTAKPRQPGSSPKGPSSGIDHREAKNQEHRVPRLELIERGRGCARGHVQTDRHRNDQYRQTDRSDVPDPVHAPANDAPTESSQARQALGDRDDNDCRHDEVRKPGSLPNGSVDQAIKYERTKKITSSRRRTKVRKPFVGVAAALPVTSTV